jgi:molybdenum cofactor cytidylyltransferase
MPPRRIVAILLAAGASRRMGTPKPLLLWQGEPLGRSVARRLQEGGASEVIVIVSPDAVGDAITTALSELPGIRTVTNPDPNRGMLSSVQAGIDSASDVDAFLVCPCDLPRLSSEDVAAVLVAWSGALSAIVAPTFGGKRGHPTLFGANYAEEIRALDPHSFGLNEILRRHTGRITEVSVASEGILRDADTPEEWQVIAGNSGL